MYINKGLGVLPANENVCIIKKVSVSERVSIEQQLSKIDLNLILLLLLLIIIKSHYWDLNDWITRENKLLISITPMEA